MSAEVQRQSGVISESHEPSDANDPQTHESVQVVRKEQETLWNRLITPGVVLFVFTFLNFVTYCDRGAIVGSMTVIKNDADIKGDSIVLSDTKAGLIFSGFMIGFTVSCPFFAGAGGFVPSKWIIAAGMVVWLASMIGTAFSKSYGILLMFRIFDGVGEAAFVGFTVTVIDAIAPAKRRTLWIGTFYSMIPVGTAIGMAFGGFLSTRDPIGGYEGWRVAFLAIALAAAPLLLIIIFFPSKYNMRREDDKSYLPLHEATMKLFTNVGYLLVVFGYAMYCFVMGGLSVWSIPLLVEGPLQLANVEASLIMGGVTAITGIAGSVVGGLVVDKFGGSSDITGVMRCQLFSVGVILISLVVGTIAFFIEITWLFATLLAISVFILFTVTAPVNATILTVVPWDQRAYAVSYSVLIIHMLGDFPSPTLAGYLSDEVFSKGCRLHNSTDVCNEDVESSCRWIESDRDGSQGHCVSKYQLRNALLVVFSFIFLAIPSWLAVYSILSRMKKCGSSSGQ
uniref:Putative major facilitator superfamily protein (MFS) n=1 Tax=Trypanosoma congolense (strain IL3000) TaxID=1068625 RepID=G0UYF0_TRYCI|nr:putative major facilitator superfamily protein (MFS) [Trypanosoma congolense IL3000]